MKQILLRVPDELHRRLAARAKRDGRSVNSLATELLDVGADGDSASRQQRVRVRAVALGLADTAVVSVGPAGERDVALAATRGWGPLADGLVDDERDRL